MQAHKVSNSCSLLALFPSRIRIYVGARTPPDGCGSRGLTSYRTEWTIFAEPEWLAGSIDFVAKAPDGRLVIFDWKRSKELPRPY
jgi:hypothetical protein